MKTYELVVIFKSELEDKQEDLLKQLKNILSKEGIAMLSEQWWGVKPLAYEINKHIQGLYLFAQLQTENVAVSRVVAHEFKNDDRIIRHLLVRQASQTRQDTSDGSDSNKKQPVPEKTKKE